MNLQDTLQADLTDALKAKDVTRRTVLRALLTAIRNAEIQQGGPLDEAQVTAVLSKQLKQRQESATAYAGRPELAAIEEAEAAIISTYLPEALNPAELEGFVIEAIAVTGATSRADIGKVMGELKPRIAGRADGGTVAAMVKSQLE